MPAVAEAFDAELEQLADGTARPGLVVGGAEAGCFPRPGWEGKSRNGTKPTSACSLSIASAAKAPSEKDFTFPERREALHSTKLGP
jgi:hypothetical protein